MNENLLPDEWDRAYAAGLEAARAAVTMTHDSSDIGTIAHLPECPWADRGYAFPCICDRLRACEQRVRDTALREAIAAVAATYDEVLGFPPRSVVLAAIQRLIDGPDMTPSDGGER